MNANVKTAARLRPVIRVFVSSTFSDMKHERNALHADVFPKLEQLCQKSGFQFQAIDLRWGVSSEAGLDHRTMRICFDELKRAQEISPEPNFLVLLGGRYGWRPLPEEISQSEFDRLMSFAKGENNNHLKIPGIHGKSSSQILKDWYRCDENIILAECSENESDCETLNYILQPRTQNLYDGHDYKRKVDDPTKDTQDWIDIQQVLWRIINAAFPYELMNHRFDRDWNQHIAEVNAPKHLKRAIPQIARFQTSATEQEIWCGALSASNAENHVIACFREITNKDIFDTSELGDFYNLKESGEFDSFSSTCQRDLKNAITSRLGSNIPIKIPFNRLKRDLDKLGVDATDETTKMFCDEVFERIKPIIERQIEEYWEKSTPSSPERTARELNIERNEHKRFGTERGGKKSFIGREDELQAIRDYLKNNSSWPMLIHGASGCGKTALLARAFEDIAENQKPIIRFIGTTPYSSDIRSLLLSLCQELRERKPLEDTLPQDTKALKEELHLQLQTIPKEEQLILFLDALDQLSDAENGRSLSWIPYGQLPPNVKLVLSCLSDRPKDDPAGQPYIALTNRQLPEENKVNLDVLTEEEADILLFRNWLPQAGRKLSDLQRECIEKTLETNECCQPIYLKLLFEEVRLWRSYDAIPKVGKDMSALLHQLFDRLSQEANHGHLLVERVLGYLTASRYGLAETEILEILFADTEYIEKFNEDNKKNRHELPLSAKRIPIAIWSRLRFDLAPYFTDRAAPGANVLAFYHRHAAEWVQDHFGKLSDQNWNPHQRLAEYFRDLADPEKNQSWKGLINRPFLEVTFHLIKANMWPILVDTIEDIFFLEAKIAHKLLFELLNDFIETLRNLPKEHPHHQILKCLKDAMRRNIHFINYYNHNFPHSFFQCMWNSCWWFDDAENSETFDVKDNKIVTKTCHPGIEKIKDLLELWLIQKTHFTPGFLWTRSLRSPPISGGSEILVIPCEKYLPKYLDMTFSEDSSHLVRLSEENVSFWNIITGEFITSFSMPGCLFLKAIFISARPIVFGIQNDCLRAWDPMTRSENMLFEGASGDISLFSISVASSVIIGANNSGFLRVWSTDNGVLLGEWDTYGNKLSCLAIAPDGTFAVTVEPQLTRFWNVKTGVLILELQISADCVAISPNSTEIAFGIRKDGTIALYNFAKRIWCKILEGHKPQYPIRQLEYSQNGRWLLSASFDMQVCVWNRKSNVRRSYLGHKVTPEAATISNDGHLASCDSDGEIIIRTIDDFDYKLIPDDHSDWIDAIWFSSLSRQIATCSEDSSIRIWNADSGKLEKIISDAGDKVSFSLNGKVYALVRSNGSLEVRDSLTHEVIFLIPEICNTGHYQTLALRPSDTFAAAGLETGMVAIIDLENWHPLCFINIKPRSIAFSPDGCHLACLAYIDDDGSSKIGIYNSESGIMEKLLECPGDQCLDHLLFSQNGEYVLISSSLDLHVWDWRRDEYVLVKLNSCLDTCFSHRQDSLLKASDINIISMTWNDTKNGMEWNKSDGSTIYVYPLGLSYGHLQYIGDGRFVGSSANRLEIIQFEGKILMANNNPDSMKNILNNYLDELRRKMQPLKRVNEKVFRFEEIVYSKEILVKKLPEAVRQAYIQYRAGKIERNNITNYLD